MEISNIGVVGSGVMGQGIAQVFAKAGYKVTIVDVNEQILENALKAISDGKYGLRNLVNKGQISENDLNSIMSRISTSTEYTSLSSCDFIVEAVPEDLRIKREVFAKLESNVSKDTILASNTSGIMIAEITSGLSYKERIIGMHWFNPAPVMKLIEVVKAQLTSEETFNTTMELAKEIGKVPIKVADVPGFYTTRFIEGWLLSAIRSAEQGVATRKDIDAMTKMAFGFLWGPLNLWTSLG